MAYNRYRGNSGRMERVEDAVSPPGFAGGEAGVMPAPSAPRPTPPPPAARRPPGPLTGMSGELGRLLNRLSPMKLETEDLLLILILYLLYRESGDEEFLIMIGGLLFL